MADPGVQFIFLRATKDLLEMARHLGQDSTFHEIEDWVERLRLVRNGYGMKSWWLLRARSENRKFARITNASMLSFYAGVGSVEQQNKSIDNCANHESL